MTTAIPLRHRAPQEGAVRVSFELFPPKNDAMMATLQESLPVMAGLSPQFVSVTCGAGGTSADPTAEIVSNILSTTTIPVAAHLTCAAFRSSDVDEMVANYWQAGVRHMVALRGDSPRGIGEPFQPHPQGYKSTPDLISAIRNAHDMDISVSAYPERHPDSPTTQADIDMLAAKVDAGATRALTQFFFDNDHYYRYLERVRARGIDIPILPGIMPIRKFSQMKNFAERCGASIPTWLEKRFEGLDDDPVTHKMVSVATAIEQVLDLVDHGVTEFHFYAMNRTDLVVPICQVLGIRTKEVVAKEVAS
jgi:methylenetetrahydrofolate reductase (NADPH)